MTGNELLRYKNKTGYLDTKEGFRIPVRVLEARERFGKLELYVCPICGYNCKWVLSTRIELTGAVPR